MSNGRNIADTLKTVVENDSTTLTNHLLGLEGSQEQVANAGDKDSKIMLHLIKIGLSPVKVVGGIAMLAGGLVVSVIPKKKIEIVTAGVTSIEVGNEDEDKGSDEYEIKSIGLTSNYAAGITATRKKIEAQTFPGGEPIVALSHDTDTTQLPLPQLPTNAPLVDYSTRRKPVSTNVTTTSVSGIKVAAAGISEVVEGTYDALAGISSLAIEGGRRLYGLYKAKTSTTTAPTQQPVAGPKRS
jgi:hypothetical protein